MRARTNGMVSFGHESISEKIRVPGIVTVMLHAHLSAATGILIRATLNC